MICLWWRELIHSGDASKETNQAKVRILGWALMYQTQFTVLEASELFAMVLKKGRPHILRSMRSFGI